MEQWPSTATWNEGGMEQGPSTAIVLSVLLLFFCPLYCLFFSFSFDHCIVCSSLFLLPIVLSVLFLLPIVLSVLLFFFWPLYCLPFSFSFAHCIVCPSIYDFLLLLCYLQTFLPRVIKYNCKDYKSARTKVALKIFRRSVNMIDHTTILRPLRIRNNKDIIFEILLV